MERTDRDDPPATLPIRHNHADANASAAPNLLLSHAFTAARRQFSRGYFPVGGHFVRRREIPMLCTKIVRLFNGASADIGVEQASYLVEFDDNAATPTDALYAQILDGETVVAQVPPDLSEHPSKPAMKVTAKHAEHHEGSRRKFRVSVTWSVPSVSWGAAETKPEGTDVKWNKNISVSGVEIDALTNTKNDSKPLLNSYGDLLGSVPKTLYDEIITITHNSDVVPSATIAALRGKVNNADVTLSITKGGVTRTATYPAHTLKVGNVTYDIELDSAGAGSFKITIPLICRTQIVGGSQIGWKVPITDKGYRYLNDAGKTIRSEVEVYLDGSGKKLAAGADEVKIIAPIEDEADISPLLVGYTPAPPPEP
jgi:hypothetical protein